MSDLPTTTEHNLLDEAIFNLQAMYLKNLDNQIKYFDELLVSINNNQKVLGALTEIQEKSHRIYGVAGTLGFNQLGDIAKRVEAMAEEISQTTCNRECLRKLASLLEQMLAHMHDLQRRNLRPLRCP